MLETCVNTINLDTIPSRLEYNDENVLRTNNYRVYGYAPGNYRVESLLNWRELERRTFAIQSRSNAYSNALWTTLKRLRDAAKEEHGADGLWVVDPDPSKRVLTYERGGVSFATMTELIERNMKKTPETKHAIIDGEQARTLHRYHERWRTWLRRAGVFKHALLEAISSRLKNYIEENLRLYYDDHYMDTAAGIFIIENDGRYMVLKSTPHTVEWANEYVFIDANYSHPQVTPDNSCP